MRPGGGPRTAAAGAAPLIQENGMLLSRPLAFIGADPGGPFPTALLKKGPRWPRHVIAAGRTTAETCAGHAIGRESASAPKPPLARAPS